MLLLEEVVVIWAQEHLSLVVPLRKESVVPEGRVPVLVGGDERGSLPDEGFQRLGAEELQVHVSVPSKTDREAVLPQPGEADLVEMDPVLGAQGPDLGLPGELGLDRVDGLFGPEGEAGGEIRGNGHAGHDIHVDEALVHEDLAHAVVIVGPTELESIASGTFHFPLGGQHEAGGGLAPAAAFLTGLGLRRESMDEGPVLPTGFPKLQLRVFVLGEGQERA